MALLMAALLTVVGCAGIGSDGPPSGLLTRSDDGGSEMTGLPSGRLELDPDSGCVLLSGKPVVWPKGTTLSTEPLELHLPGGQVVRPGDTIAGGGGTVPATTIQESAMRIEGDVDKAIACARRGSELVVFAARADDIVVRREGSGDRLAWASELGSVSEISDPILALRIQRAARESGARLLDVTVLAVRDGRRVPVVTLEAADPASYMKHDLEGFLEQIGHFEPRRLGFVELLDEDGRFAWSTGRFPNGGMVHPRQDLDQCSPIHHSQPFGVHTPPCPAD